MPPWSQDAVTNVVYQQIKRGVRAALDTECLGAAVILIYAGIDAMAYLDMPANQENVNRQDFANWADRYIRFPCQEQLTGWDLYGGRCGMLHNYSSFSSLTRSGKARVVGYTDEMYPEVRYDPNVDDNFVLVSVPALAKAFFTGVDQFLIDLFSHSEKAAIAEERFKKIVWVIPYNNLGD